MASGRIRGVTIEIGGDTTKLNTALKDVDSSLKSTQTQLKDVNRLLKLDPKNVDLLRQKQRLLTDAVSDTKDRLAKLKDAYAQLQQKGNTEENQRQMDALEREIIETENSLKGLESELASTKPSLQAVGAAAEEVANKTRALSAAAAGVGAAMLGMAYKAGKTADEYNTLSKQTGFSTDQLQMFAYAADRVDVSLDDITGAATKMKKSMQANEELFNSLGVSIRNVDGSLRDSTEVFFDAIEALSQIENETERDTVAMTIFGKSADQLAGIIDDGGASLAALGQEARDAGLILSGDALNAANQFNDSLDELKAKAQAAFLEAGASLAETLIPALENLVTALSSVLSWLANIDGQTLQMILTVVAIIAAISPLASVIAAITTAIGALGTVMTLLSGPVGLVMALIAAVIVVGVKLVKSWDEIKESALQTWEWIKDKWEKIKTKTSEVWENVKSKVTGVMDNIKESVHSRLNSMRSAFDNAGGGIKGVVAAMWQGIKDNYTAGFNLLNTLTGGKLGQIKDAIKNAFTSLASAAFSWGRDIIQNIANGITSMISHVVSAVSGVASRIRSYLHFSEPDEGPLADFNTWMPDMMKQMAAQIKDYTGLVQDAAAGVAGSIAAPIQAGGAVATYNYGGISVNVNAGNQDPTAIADAVMVRIQEATQRKVAVWQ